MNKYWQFQQIMKVEMTLVILYLVQALIHKKIQMDHYIEYHQQWKYNLYSNTFVYLLKMQPQEYGQNNGNSAQGMRFRDKTKSLLVDSFKMGGSFFGSTGTTKTVHKLIVQDLRLVEKQQYLKQENCQICFIYFSKLTRQHHCRVCANAVCTSCSLSSINKERACDICAYKYSSAQRELKKGEFLTSLRRIIKSYLIVKTQSQKQLKNIQSDIPPENTIKQEQLDHQRKTTEMNRRLTQLKQQRQAVEREILDLKSA